MHNNDVYNASEIRGTKKLMSSRDSYVDTAIGYVEVKREGSKCVLKAKVTPEHRIRTKIYTVSITINEDSEVIGNLICDDCAASAGGCKHGIFLHTGSSKGLKSHQLHLSLATGRNPESVKPSPVICHC
ncbi:unnamed protein product [Parnassius apollo]|uniref:(apollo) hypothetical protein n=1 Tax=Parnassius apollo TaxID=110799 RepID=A0A8S3XGB5_PARAO|nr:unnamed protein product [Parnassius apollo]